MNKNELIAKVESLKEWEALAAEAAAEIEAIKDELKREMQERGVEELEAGTHIIRWTSVLSNRFDSTAFKKCTRLIASRSTAAASLSARNKKPLA